MSRARSRVRKVRRLMVCPRTASYTRWSSVRVKRAGTSSNRAGARRIFQALLQTAPRDVDDVRVIERELHTCAGRAERLPTTGAGGNEAASTRRRRRRPRRRAGDRRRGTSRRPRSRCAHAGLAPGRRTRRPAPAARSVIPVSSISSRAAARSSDSLSFTKAAGERPGPLEGPVLSLHEEHRQVRGAHDEEDGVRRDGRAGKLVGEGHGVGSFAGAPAKSTPPHVAMPPTIAHLSGLTHSTGTGDKSHPSARVPGAWSRAALCRGARGRAHSIAANGFSHLLRIECSPSGR